MALTRNEMKEQLLELLQYNCQQISEYQNNISMHASFRDSMVSYHSGKKDAYQIAADLLDHLKED